MKTFYLIFSIGGVVLGIVAICLGIYSGQNIKNELKDTRVRMITTTQRSDLLTKVVNIESYLDDYLITLAKRLKLIETDSQYKVSEYGQSVLLNIDVFNYLQTIYFDQPDISRDDLIIHILSEDKVSKKVWDFNHEREKKEKSTIPLGPILATIIVNHEQRNVELSRKP